MPDRVIRVLIVDDHAIVRLGIAGTIADVEGIEIAGEAADGREALGRIRHVEPDVTLMDLRMPVMNGVDAILEIGRQNLGTAILVLTTYDADADILRAIEAGANGYLLKDATQVELSTAIRSVAAGESWLAPGIASRLMGQMRRPGNESLSSRELDVLKLVARGFSNKEIGIEIHVSQATVKSHLIHIFRKLDVNDRTAAVTVALDRGMIDLGRS